MVFRDVEHSKCFYSDFRHVYKGNIANKLSHLRLFYLGLSSPEVNLNNRYQATINIDTLVFKHVKYSHQYKHVDFKSYKNY
jgi:hypothetical protein